MQFAKDSIKYPKNILHKKVILALINLRQCSVYKMAIKNLIIIFLSFCYSICKNITPDILDFPPKKSIKIIFCFHIDIF